MNKFQFRILLFIAMFLPAVIARGQNFPDLDYSDEAPKFEMRGAWIATVFGIDWPATKGTSAETAQRQKADLEKMIKGLHDSGFNAVFFQARPMADALYSSSIAPWSSYVSGCRGSAPAYDPLQYCIEICHKYGLECHVWINPFRVGQTPPATKLDKAKSHLWMTNTVGSSKMTILNPAHPETHDLLREICREIASNYDIDGIIFDDYFYHPEFIPENKSAADWKDYVNSGSELSIGDWRRENINQAMEAVYTELQQLKNGKIRFGISPQGIAGGNGAHSDDGVPPLAQYGVSTGDSQYAKIYSDPVEWLKRGIIDYISPQIYWPTTQTQHPYGGLSSWWNDVAELFGRHCFPSHTIAEFAAKNSEPNWNERLKQLMINREESSNGFPGSIFYSATYINGPKKSGFGDYLRDNAYSSRALVPPMTWKNKNAKRLTIPDIKASGNKISWNKLGDSRYVIYVVPKDLCPDDYKTSDGKSIKANFIHAVTYDNSYSLPDGFLKNYRIAVAPYDRYGNEWTPKFLNDRS